MNPQLGSGLGLGLGLGLGSGLGLGLGLGLALGLGSGLGLDSVRGSTISHKMKYLPPALLIGLSQVSQLNSLSKFIFVYIRGGLEMFAYWGAAPPPPPAP